MVVKRVPYLIVTVESDRIGDAESLHGLFDVGQLLLGIEFWGVDSDHYKTAVPVLVCPGTNVRNGADAVDAGIVPEIHENNLPLQLFRCHARKPETSPVIPAAARSTAKRTVRYFVPSIFTTFQAVGGRYRVSHTSRRQLDPA